MASAPSKQLKVVMKAATGLHVALYRLSKGRFGNRIANLPVLLLTTFGRKSGTPFTNPVVFIQDGQDYLVSASAGGADWHPGWYLNLRRSTKARMEIGEKVFNVQAEIMEGESRAWLYEKFKAASSNFEKYEKGTNRVIPVIRLTPVQEGN